LRVRQQRTTRLGQLQAVTAALSKNQWSAKDAFECGKRFGHGRLCQAERLGRPIGQRRRWGAALKDRLMPFSGGPGRVLCSMTHPPPDHFDPPPITQVLGSTGRIICGARGAANVASQGFRVRGLALFSSRPLRVNAP
jgi:hypothetical protein